MNHAIWVTFVCVLVSPHLPATMPPSTMAVSQLTSLTSANFARAPGPAAPVAVLGLAYDRSPQHPVRRSVLGFPLYVGCSCPAVVAVYHPDKVDR